MSAIVPYGNGTAYLIPTFVGMTPDVGMTPEFNFRSIPTAPRRPHLAG
jgi:hypothetical protein